MANKEKIVITYKPVQGTIDRFYAFVNDTRVISINGNKEKSWESDIDEKINKIKIVAAGRASAQFKLSIDLPGTKDDVKSDIKLKEGYHESTYVY